MKLLAKAAVVLVPVLLILLGLRAMRQGDAKRWQARILEHDPAASIAVDEEDLIVIAPDLARGRELSGEVVDFRAALIAQHADLVGPGRDQRMVVVLFSTLDQLQAYAGTEIFSWRGRKTNVHGFTDGSKGAVFLPPGSDRATLRHETVHLVMAQSFGGTVRFSPWLSEGLAQLFEPPAPGLGDRAGWLLQRFLPGDSLDVDRLLAIEDYDEFTGPEAMRNYLEASVLTAFLYHGRPRELLARYVAMERQRSVARPLAFRSIYEHDQEPFRRDLKEFIRGEKTRR